MTSSLAARSAFSCAAAILLGALFSVVGDSDVADIHAYRQGDTADLAPKHTRRAVRIAYRRYPIARAGWATYYVPPIYRPHCAGNLANSVIGACPLCVPLLSLAQDEAHCYID
jgi:hypothetical protein